MLLETAAAVSILGFAAFGFGAAYRRPELAMVGAIIIVGLGATAQIDGVLIKTGEIHNQTDNTTVIENQYEPISTHSQFPLPMMIIFLGVLMLFYGTGWASEQ